MPPVPPPYSLRSASVWFLTGVLAAGLRAYGGEELARQFADPPDSARPWVWGHWLHGNVSRESIQRELEAMKRVGLGGVTMFDVAQPGIPAGPHAYLGPGWQELFAFQIAEARRLGLEVMSQNGPGYSGNGGPWIRPELAAQKLVASEMRVSGGRRFSGQLPPPETHGGFYRDVAVLAVKETEVQAQHKIADLDMKRLVWLNYIKWAGTRSAPLDAVAPPDVCIPRGQIVDLTGRRAVDGTLTWEVPPGAWTILRFGHTWTGQKTLPAPPAGEGPECDKLDRRGIQAHFNHVMKCMVALAGPAAGGTFHTFFVDSWEAGGQNWTERMPAEFKRRRGYDIVPFLPVMTGRVVDDLQTSERFLYDLRQTVSDLVAENFWGEMQRLCHAHGMRLAAQPYITTGNDLDAALHVDEPMGEFWAIANTTTDYRQTIKAAVSTADLNGGLVVGAEAFTSTAQERWQSHPATLKLLGDQMFCLGANRFQIHRFAMQRFPELRPGLMMGGWGQQYDRTQTWWEWSRPWHDYLARCQLLLRHGPVVADVLRVVPEEPLYRFEHRPIPGYDYDACGPAMFKHATIRDGMIGFPGGRRYPLAVVEHAGTMTLERLRHLRKFVAQGAAVLAEPPAATPGLAGAPHADAQLRALAAELWGAKGETDRRFGQGRIFRQMSPEVALQRLGVARDFTGPANLSWIHRASADTDVYFVASSAAEPVLAPCTFRVHGRAAELWDPETGTRQPLDTFPADGVHTTAYVPLGPGGAMFVVFRAVAVPPPAVVAIRHNGGAVFPPSPAVPTPARLPEPTPGPDGIRAFRLQQGGLYEFAFADGRTVRHRVEPIPVPQTLADSWQISFPPECGVPTPLALDRLTSWSEHADARVRHFSGTAVYRRTFTLPQTDSRVVLDLGRVEIMARVRLNSRDLGILWRPPFRIDITDAVRAGDNELEVAVVNLWVNRLIGDAALPEDAPRDKTGRLVAWPEWVLGGKTSPAGRGSFVTFPLWKKDEPLKESGLLGPVTLTFPRLVRIEP